MRGKTEERISGNRQPVGRNGDVGRHEGKSARRHAADIPMDTGTRLQLALVKGPQGDPGISQLGGQNGCDGQGVHKSPGGARRIYGDLPPVTLNVTFLGGLPEAAFDAVYNIREDDDVERTERIQEISDRYRHMMRKLCNRKRVIDITPMLERSLHCLPSANFVEERDMVADNKERTGERGNNAYCRNAIPCPYCRNRFVRDILNKRIFDPEYEYICALGEYTTREPSEFGAIRKIMTHRSRELKRRLSQWGDIHKFTCVDARMRGGEIKYVFREALVIDSVGIEPRDIISRHYRIESMGIDKILGYVYQYSDMNLISLEVLDELLNIKYLDKYTPPRAHKARK